MENKEQTSLEKGELTKEDYATIKEAFIIDELQKYMDLSNPSEPKWVENVRLRLQEKKDWEIDKLKALADQKRKIFSGIGKILQEWNCQNNPKIRTTINTVQMRIGDFKTEFEELI